jgi:pimeloyl-ACP methyl ester carboxylesterase
LNWYRAAARRGLKSYFRRQKSSARRVKPPTLILWGKRDIALSLDMVGPSIELCDEGQAVIYDKATHWVQLDAADEVNGRLIGFLG